MSDGELDLTYEEARETLANIDSLLDSKGWVFLTEFLGERAAGLERLLSRHRIRTQEDIADYNKLQGRVEELLAIVPTLGAVRSDIQEAIHKMQDQMAEQEESDA